MKSTPAGEMLVRLLKCRPEPWGTLLTAPPVLLGACAELLPFVSPGPHSCTAPDAFGHLDGSAVARAQEPRCAW